MFYQKMKKIKINDVSVVKSMNDKRLAVYVALCDCVKGDWKGFMFAN